MTRCISIFAGALLALGATGAWASFHTYVIDSVYSNADGSVQYVVLRETAGFPDERFLAGHNLTATHAGVTKTFPFPADLPSGVTGNQRVLLATQGFVALHLIAPDYILPNQFLATDGATLDYAGVDQLTYAALPIDGVNALSRSGAPIPNLATNLAGASAVVPPLSVTAVEFYHAALDHYFISPLQPDIDALDSGRIAGWARTGQSFRVFATQAGGGAGVNPVCRFYIPPAHGNSHFFSASPAECAAIQQKTLTDPNFSGYVFESPNVFYIALPDTTTGACPASTVPVYRLWNQRADSNHRYTADPAIKALMLTKSYLPEGYGPNAVIMCAPAPGTATVRFIAGAGEPNGALVSDGAAIPSANYQAYTTPSDTVNVGARVGSGEVIAFSKFRPVALQSVAWTTAGGDQSVNLPFAPNQFDTPVTFWIVAGPYATTQQTALTLWQTAQQIYWDERLGVRLANPETIDATASSKAATWNAFTCGNGNANVAAIEADIGVRAGRLNVYIVNLVDGSTSRGNSCTLGGNFSALAAGAGAELLAHELGHDFSLEHIDDLSLDFNPTNVMHSASNTRLFLTEGQLFRAHLRPSSAINAVFGLRAGQTIRNCDRDTLTLDCPSIHKRIWADGMYPAN